MNIAMISYHTCPRASEEGKETGGMNVYVLELSKALAKLGHTVDIFTRSHESNDPVAIDEAPGLRVFHIQAGPRAIIPKRLMPRYIPEFIETARKLVGSSARYDIMHAHYYQSGLVAEKVLALRRIPFVMTFHTLGLMKNLVARDTLEREGQTRIKAEVSLVARADAIIASSENDRDYLSYLYDAETSRIHVVHPGINTDLFHPAAQGSARKAIGADSTHKIILFVGRIEPLKGIDTLLFALKILKSQNPTQTVCLWIVGGDISEPEERWPKTLKYLSQLRKDLGIPPESVHFVGRQPQTKLPDYYNAADVVVMPSHYESFGMAALEAMGCGVPVITTNVTGVSAHVEHVISANNPIALAGQISHVLGTPHTRKAFTSFTWGEAALKTVGVYSSVIR